MEKNRYAVIMAGGVGSRLWPVSRKSYPKQFHDILGVGKTLLQMTFERLLQVCAVDNIFIVTNDTYKGIVKEQLPQLAEERILCEPQAKNTAPCIAYASYKIASINPEASILIAPSDHLITNDISFASAADLAYKETNEKDQLITFGIKPSRPDTGYGYIEYHENESRDTVKVERFTEKPDLTTAEEFLSKGNYLWNAGIFVWSAKSIISALEKYTPQISSLFAPLLSGTQDDFCVKSAFQKCDSVSIDYGIMEKANNVFVVPVSFGWTDLGTWKSIFETNIKNEDNNAFHGQVISEETTNTLVKIQPNKVAVVQGLEDYIVIDNEKALLICQKEKEQRVKGYLKEVAKIDQDFV
ncbi:mannose-1-phosphate guanylyltransferase [Algivirga pacifica]|uniref:Mannose-1-phosphate guanylyltransferase n=1 Tax=Algivirga pacifica TaxID=1162670 RepID=A0ABP9D3Y2_9BACT